jgi:hypothetical protein
MRPPSAPSPRRAIAAALVTLGVVAVSQPGPGAAGTFAWGLPLLVGSAGWIWGRLARSDAMASALDAAFAVLLLVPAVAARQQTDAMARFDLAHVPANQLLDGMLLYAARATEGTAPLLVAGAAGYVVLGRRAAAPGIGVLLSAAAAAAGATSAVFAAREALASGDVTAAAEMLVGLPYVGLLIVPGALLGVAMQGREVAWSRPRMMLLALAGLAAAYTVTTPLVRMAAEFPVPATALAVPLGAPGMTTLVPAVEGAPALLADQLHARGHYHAKRVVWGCHPAARRWSVRLRATEALALPADAGIQDVDQAAAVFNEWSTTRLALIGRAETPPGGPISDLLSWPAVPLLLDRPPNGAAPIAVGTGGFRHLGPTPPRGTPCVLIPDPDIRVGDLWAAGRALLQPEGPCDGLGLLPPQHREAVRADPEALAGLTCDDP